MERKKREAAQKIKDYRSFHLVGELSSKLEGQVAQGIANFEPRSPSGHKHQRTWSAPSFQTHTHDATDCIVQTTVQTTIDNTTPEAVTLHRSHPRNLGHDIPTLTYGNLGDRNRAAESRDHYLHPTNRENHRGTPHTSLHTHIDYTQNSNTVADHTQPTNPVEIDATANTTSNNMAEQMRAELQKQKEETRLLQEQVAQAEVLNDLEREKQQQEAWRVTLDKLKQAKEEQDKAHAAKIASIHAVDTTPSPLENPQLEWLKKKMAELQGSNPQPEEVLKKNEEIQKAKSDLEAILQQQKQLAEKATLVMNSTGVTTPDMDALMSAIRPEANERTLPQPQEHNQQSLLEQLKASLQPKSATLSGDWQKDMLRQFLTNSSKTGGAGGATVLKPEILKKLTNEQDEFSMADWLATLNKQDAGEWQCDELDECSHKKVKSGMLDRATSNIVHKEIWPQKNLLEDWADEDMEFKHLQFEHHIAGEVRTIETCTEPAQILGRLRLLRRMAYAKLRGYDWPIIRKMYAAILRSIEAKEYTWTDNFDRFETILYRRTQGQNREQNRVRYDREQTKKWFCRDWNKAEGCSKQSPHKAWFGTGQNAISRSVVHICAACYMKDRSAKDHPECSDICPHKAS